MEFTEKDKRIINKLKSVVLSLDDTAELILFGSRARGDFNDDSDYDFLILTDNEVNHSYRKLIFNSAYDIQLDENVFLQEVIRNKVEWKTKHSITPLFLNIKADGITL